MPNTLCSFSSINAEMGWEILVVRFKLNFFIFEQFLDTDPFLEFWCFLCLLLQRPLQFKFVIYQFPNFFILMKSFFQLQLFYSIFTNLITKSKQGIKIFLSFIKSVKIIEGQDIGKYFAFALSFYAAVILIDGTLS